MRCHRTNPLSFLISVKAVHLLYYYCFLTSNYAGFKANLNHAYLLTVIARGRSISLYVDKQWLATVEDQSSSSGAIGLMAYDKTQPTEVAFRNMKVWELP